MYQIDRYIILRTFFAEESRNQPINAWWTDNIANKVSNLHKQKLDKLQIQSPFLIGSI